MLCWFIKLYHNAKNVRIITGAHYREHTAPIFNHFFKLVDVYQLQVNKCVLSFLKDLLPSSLKHLFTLWQNQHGRHIYQTLDSIQINGAKNAPWLHVKASSKWVLKHRTFYHMISTCASHYSYLVRVSHPDSNDPHWRAMMTNPIFFAHVFMVLHILLMSGIGWWGQHKSSSIRFEE